jgi:hypothetical protein
MPEARRGMRQKPFKLFDVNLTNIGFVDGFDRTTWM